VNLRRYLPVLAGAGVLGSSFPAFAVYTAPAAFTTAVADASEAVGVLAGALIGVAAAAVVIMIALKYVKKIRSAT